MCEGDQAEQEQGGLPSIVGKSKEFVKAPTIALQAQKRVWLLQKQHNKPLKIFNTGKGNRKHDVVYKNFNPKNAHSPTRLTTSVDTESVKSGGATTKLFSPSPKF